MATVNQQEMGLQGGANMAEAATLKMNCSGGYEEEGVKTERREGSGGPLKTHTQTETHTHGDTHTETHREGDRYLVGQVQGDSCRMSLFEFWRTRKERGQVLQRSRETKLSPSELKQLLCDSGVRAALGGSKVASLLPPVDKEVFRRFTAASQEESQQQHDAKKEEDNDKDTMIGQPRPAEDLEAGKPLPFFYGDPPPELLNTPLEELDPFYQSEQTFLVLGRGNVIHRFSSGPSCFLFRPLSPVRIAAIRVLIH
ncbi:hypothetical protein PFLUV_G00092590 [Xyrichtys novacula]|uniref:Uncharacterized protein n=1 Tax=Xyrichtys novacula TaxID=13765 RepID=A0AAV1F4X4_XYRNO|nr:hypothetical protein PFLUV_G00092590 [Xyrichtys novacula]